MTTADNLGMMMTTYNLGMMDQYGMFFYIIYYFITNYYHYSDDAMIWEGDDDG